MSAGNKCFVGAPAPDFKCTAVLPDGSFVEKKLSDFQGKYLYILSFPLAFTFVCPSEITAFSDAAKEFAALGCEVVAMSVDSPFTLLQWSNQPRKEGGLGGMEIPLLSDLSKTMSTDYGLMCTPCDGATMRGSVLISDKGIVRHVQINDRPVGRSVEEALRLVAAYIHTDNNDGEACPAGWVRGGSTIKTNPKDKVEFFEEQEAKKQKK